MDRREICTQVGQALKVKTYFRKFSPNPSKSARENPNFADRRQLEARNAVTAQHIGLSL